MIPTTWTQEQMERTQALGEMMSDLSQELWYAGWYSGLEFYLPLYYMNAQGGGSVQIGLDPIPLSMFQPTWEAAQALGHWATLNLDENESSTLPAHYQYRYLPFDPTPVLKAQTSDDGLHALYVINDEFLLLRRTCLYLLRQALGHLIQRVT